MQLKDATVLIADDEPGFRTLLRKWFEAERCRVLVAENGAEALHLVRTNDVHLLVSDVRMPVMDGIELMRRLMEGKHYLPKVILISGFSDIEDRESFDLGVEASLAKPIRRQVMASVVRRCLMDRDERWRELPAEPPPEKVLTISFPSLATARQQGLIAFGRGGFCVRSRLAVGVTNPIQLDLDFKGDGRALIGQGIVRWTEPREEQIGIEITFVEDAYRAWVVDMTECDGSLSFIPRTSGPQMAAVHANPAAANE
jgi:CheY-like chemotaxis protein